ncbi:MAG TPA: NAD(+) kinase [Spirochaetia bacterium]|nr:MAG: hypothetical protein A2Y41_01275 [Spirochaetes bacterium GWB1_36_13]HCL56583.1 NAD(+) kinase [Spirochaetia bacterium]
MRALVFYSERKNTSSFLKYLKEELDLLKIQSVFIPLTIEKKMSIDFEIDEETDFAVSLGGDGTVLHVTRILYHYSIPIFPVNFGNLGFITEIKQNELIHMIKEYLNQKIGFDYRLMLETNIHHQRHHKVFTGFALNEITLTRTIPCKLIEIEVKIDEHYVSKYRADGLIIATPTGSTAYSLSAGGPILEPGLNNFIITPISPHSLRLRPLVISSDKEIELKVLTSGESMVTLDGQEIHYLKDHEIVVVKSAAKRIKIARPDKRNFYNVLKEKLNWQE